MGPVGYGDENRLRGYAKWVYDLETNFNVRFGGHRWLEKPSISEMNIDDKDRKTWARDELENRRQIEFLEQEYNRLKGLSHGRK